MATRSLEQYSDMVQAAPSAGDSDTLPADFLTALQRGWQIEGETTALADGRKCRHGRIILREGNKRIQFEYTASSKTGFQFGKPELIGCN
jgi:hypothetical protein